MQKISRILKIFYVLWRYGLFELLQRNIKPGLIFFLVWPLALQSPARYRPRGERLRLTLEDLGPVFIKFGQVLSTRRDLLPEDIADELAKLQDSVPPFSSSQSAEIVQAALGLDLKDIFSSFDANPVASASVAQVHFGVLRGTEKNPEWEGQSVAIKVLRPGILKVIESDLALMRTLA